jgi:ATP-dependent exoDNAse (exonuclease V) alpha subunit
MRIYIKPTTKERPRFNTSTGRAFTTNKTRDFINIRTRQSLGMPDNPVYGDRVICKNNNWEEVLGDIALTNGLTGFISSPVTVENFCFKNKNLFRMDFKPDLINMSFTNLKVNYEYLLSDNTERNKIKNNKFNHNTGELFEYAYALTTHSAQGSEYNSGIYIEEHLRPEIQTQLVYTGITRFRQNLIYVKRARRFY